LTETVFAICVAVLLIVLAIVIGVPPVTAGRDNLENPDPLNIAEFAIEHDESHQGSASDIRQARTPELALALGCLNGLNLAVQFSGACAQRPMMTTCCHSLFCSRSARRGECICSGALLWTVVPRALCWGIFSRLGQPSDGAEAAACKLCGLCCCLRLRLSLPVTVLNLIAV
jgi:hypothetical protein